MQLSWPLHGNKDLRLLLAPAGIPKHSLAKSRDVWMPWILWEVSALLQHGTELLFEFSACIVTPLKGVWGRRSCCFATEDPGLFSLHVVAQWDPQWRWKSLDVGVGMVCLADGLLHVARECVSGDGSWRPIMVLTKLEMSVLEMVKRSFEDLRGGLVQFESWLVEPARAWLLHPRLDQVSSWGRRSHPDSSF